MKMTLHLGWFVGALTAAATMAGHAASPAMILVAGYESDNVVQFDLVSGRWSEVVSLPQGSQPRGVAVSSSGEVFLGLHGGGKNIVRLVTGGGGEKVQPVTEAMGRFGPGFMLPSEGRLWVAGDTDRVIHQVDPVTGAVTTPPQVKTKANLVGLAAQGTSLFVAEYFQRSILRCDTTASPMTSQRFIDKSEHLDRPIGMAIGHNGNLYIANGLRPTVVEYDVKTGAFVRVLADLGAAGQPGIHAVLYAPDVRRYYVATGSDVHEISPEGTLIASYNSPALKKAYGMAFAPTGLFPMPVEAPPPAAPVASTESSALPAKPVVTLRMTPGRLQIAGAIGERYRLMATTDFVTWTQIAVLKNTKGSIDYADPQAAGMQRRFYRLELLPAAQ